MRGQATGQVPGAIQRSVSIHASKVDIREAREVARHAVQIAMYEGTGLMPTILRKPGGVYQAFYDKAALKTVANSSRLMPASRVAGHSPDLMQSFYRQDILSDLWFSN